MTTDSSTSGRSAPARTWTISIGLSCPLQTRNAIRARNSSVPPIRSSQARRDRSAFIRRRFGPGRGRIAWCALRGPFEVPPAAWMEPRIWHALRVLEAHRGDLFRNQPEQEDEDAGHDQYDGAVRDTMVGGQGEVV